MVRFPFILLDIIWCVKQMIIIALSDNSEKNNSLLYIWVYASKDQIWQPDHLHWLGSYYSFFVNNFIWHVVIYKGKKKIHLTCTKAMWFPTIKSYKNVAARLLLLPLSDISVWPVYFLFYLFVFVRSKPIFLCLYKTK